MTTKRDYYVILGIARSAQPDEMKKAYKKLAKQYHPDLNPGNKMAEEKFKDINEAYEVLSDEKARARYDQTGRNSPGGTGFGYGGGFGSGASFGNDAGFGNGAGFASAGFGGGGPGGLDNIFESCFGSGFAAYAGSGAHRSETNTRYGGKPERDAAFNQKKKQGNTSGASSGDNGGDAETQHTHRNTCSVCGGAGKIRVTQNSGFGKLSSIRICSACNGYGYPGSDSRVNSL
jgi:molecular chaperone DnaJ